MSTLYIKSGSNYHKRGYSGYETGNHIQVKIDSVVDDWYLPDDMQLDTFYDCFYTVYFPDSFTPESFHCVNDEGGISIIVANRFNLTLSFS
jgi:hypothetical protein